MEKISIIVPAYNAEKCINKCLTSILEQTYTNFELIVIDDGSTDFTANIISEYAKKDSRIITIHQENKGVSAARNAGLRKATGKYVSFVDADDYIDKEFLEKIVHGMEAIDAQIGCCNWNYVYPNGNEKSHLVINMQPVFGKKDFIYQMFVTPKTVGGSVCNKIFLKSIIGFFDEKIGVCEDNLFLLRYCFNIKKAYYLESSLYHIFEYEGSTMRSNPWKLVYGLKTKEKMIDLVKENQNDLRDIAESDYLDTCLLYCNQFKNEEESYLIAKRQLRIYIRKNLINVIRNKEIYWKTKILYRYSCLK